MASESPLASVMLNLLQDPRPSILDRLENLNRQLNFATARFGTENQFGTLKAVTQNYKPFIIGFIPPDNPINFIPIETSKQRLATVAASKDLPNTSPDELPDAFFIKLEQVCKEIPCNPVHLLAVMSRESNCCSTSTNYRIDDKNHVKQPPQKQAQGLIQFTQAALNASGIPQEQWDNLNQLGPVQQLDYVKNYYQSGNGHGARQYTSFEQLYMYTFCPNRAFPDPTTVSPDTECYAAGSDPAHQNPGLRVSRADPNSAVTTGSFVQNTKSVLYSASYKRLLAQRDAALARAANPPPADITNADKGSDTDRGLMSYGSSAATDVIGDMMARQISVAGAERQQIAIQQTAALQAQIKAIKSTPPLILLVNPSEFKRGYEQSIDDSPKGRYGHIVHRWLEKPLTITSSGVSAGQYIIDAEGSGGLTNFFRVFSISYQNLLSILSIYKNNGIIFAGQESDSGIPILAMSLFIYYDSHIYVGSFDSMGIDDKADKPYNMSYDFKFSARYDMDCDNINGNLDMMIFRNLSF
jgi:hypothetical protein